MEKQKTNKVTYSISYGVRKITPEKGFEFKNDKMHITLPEGKKYTRCAHLSIMKKIKERHPNYSISGYAFTGIKQKKQDEEPTVIWNEWITWDELKVKIDKKLKSKGADGSYKITKIDLPMESIKYEDCAIYVDDNYKEFSIVCRGSYGN